MIYVQILFGFVLLIGGAELLVRGAVLLAGRLGVSPLVIGMTVVAVGTSAPEFVVSINAALNGATGLAVGNVIGSNIANVLLVLGVACILSPMVKRPDTLKRDGVYLAFASLMFFVLCLRKELDWTAGLCLFIGFLSFIGLSYWRESGDPNYLASHTDEVEDIKSGPNSALGVAFSVIAGLVGLALGGELLVRGGTEVARSIGISEEVIGLTLFAFGTSLPELAASIIAAFKGHADIGIGNIVGSNLFNILGVAGAAALISALPVSHQILSFDIWVMLASSALLIPVLIFGWRVGRMSGTLFALVYGGYIWVQYIGVSQVIG